MGGKKSVLWKVLMAVGVTVALFGLGFLLVPEIGGLKDVLHSGDESNPVILTHKIVAAAADDRPDRVWYATHSNYRKQYVEYFDRVRKGEVATDAWVKAGKDSGEARSAEALAKLDDRSMFRVWWHLPDRSAVGFRVPGFLRPVGGQIESFVFDKVFYDKAPADTAEEGFLLYTVNGVADLLHFSKDEGRWRLDVPKDVPEGM